MVDVVIDGSPELRGQHDVVASALEGFADDLSTAIQRRLAERV